MSVRQYDELDQYIEKLNDRILAQQKALLKINNIARTVEALVDTNLSASHWTAQ